MLTLSRKPGQSIFIDCPPPIGRISVTISKVDRNKVFVSIQATREAVILREELDLARKAEQAAQP